ncbi:MAG: NAD(P)(+) transhydrogenase (Re/Si-specific) subunit alpha, partial [Herbaspirillum sp.]
MKLGIPVESREGETRVAATPETVRKLIAAQHEVLVESGAGISSSLPDEAYAATGARIAAAGDVYDAEVILKVRAPSQQERARLKSGTVVVGMLDPY